MLPESFTPSYHFSLVVSISLHFWYCHNKFCPISTTSWHYSCSLSLTNLSEFSLGHLKPTAAVAGVRGGCWVGWRGLGLIIKYICVEGVALFGFCRVDSLFLI